MYHSIVIEESLQDKNILKKYRILRTKVGEKWHLHIIEVADLSGFVKDIQSAMVLDMPYYFHVYNDNKFLKVIFKNKIFNLNSLDKNTWLEAQKYGGEKLNIPPKELDFSPNNFTTENDWYDQI